MTTEKASHISFGFKVFLAVVAGIALTDLLVYLVADQGFGGSYYEALVVMEVAKHTTMLVTFTVNAVVYLAIMAAVFVAAIVVSHRVAGPMYRFEKVSGQVRDGDLGVKFKLRDKDLMQAHAAEFGEAIEAMRAGVSGVREASAAMRGYVEAMAPKDAEGKAEGLAAVRRELARVGSELSRFSTGER